MTQYSQLKLKPEYRDKLKALADANKRSMAKEAEYLVDTGGSAIREIDRLANFLMTEYPEAITGGGAVDVAIRLIKDSH